MVQEFHKYLIGLLSLLFFISGSAQIIKQKSLDELAYEELLTLFNEYENDTINQKLIALTYLNRAKQNRDTIKMARGYDRLARIFDSETNLLYADSIIMLTENIEHKTYPALGYMIKGYEYYINGDLVNSTKSFLMGYDHSLKNKNIPQQIYISDLIVFNKALWGNSKEALALQRRRHRIIKSNEYVDLIRESTREGANIDVRRILKKDLINSYNNFAVCFLQMNKLDSAKNYIEKVFKEITPRDTGQNQSHYIYAQNLLVELLFKKSSYQEVINRVDLLDSQFDNIPKSTIVHLNYFKGRAYLSMGYSDKGMKYIKFSDSLFMTSNFPVEPYHRELTQILLNYYRSDKNYAKEITYLNRLIEIDSIFKRNYQYFEPDVIRNFETPQLIRVKQELIDKLEEKNKRNSRYALIIIGFISLGLTYFFRKQIVYKNRFNKLQKTINSEPGKASPTTHSVSKEVVNDILTKLEAFEADKGYLDTKLSLHSLAEQLSTNSNYLSKIINLNIGKSFKQYINDLRIDYALNNLLSDPRFRKYTIKAIAQESGFNSGDSFSRAFYKRHGIYPSYYIKRLESRRKIT